MAYTTRRPGRVTRETLAKRALAAALRTRRKLGLPSNEAICVYDAAEQLGVEVRFDAIPSMEGMYVKQTLGSLTPHVIVSSLRPAGRQAMTTGHELGHHFFNHGTRIDQYVKGAGTVGTSLQPADAVRQAPLHGFDEDEFLADSYGAFLLMPRAAVERGFAARNVSPITASRLDFFRIAGWLGVGYTALIHHMCWSLGLIPWSQAQRLIAERPKALREEVWGEPLLADLYVVDAAWSGRPVDLQVGDVAIVPAGTKLEATTGRFATSPRRVPGAIIANARHASVLEAATVGMGRIVGDGWAAFVRVAEREYAGRSLYRFLETDESPDEG